MTDTTKGEALATEKLVSAFKGACLLFDPTRPETFQRIDRAESALIARIRELESRRVESKAPEPQKVQCLYCSHISDLGKGVVVYPDETKAPERPRPMGMRVRVDPVSGRPWLKWLQVEAGEIGGFLQSMPAALAEEVAYRINAFEPPAPAGGNDLPGPCGECGHSWRDHQFGYMPCVVAGSACHCGRYKDESQPSPAQAKEQP